MPITSGEGNVTQLLRVDEANRLVYFQGVGRERGRDPYFRHFYRAGLDGKPPQLLTPEDADHDISLAPSGNYFVDNYSKPDVPTTSVLRDATGKVVLPLEKMDISRLLATGWKPPMPITVKDRGGVGDLYGLLYRPTNFDPAKKYPIVNRIYPGPQTGSVGSRQFSAARADSQALAELGFIVVEIDGMGTPWRSKRFHAAYYGNMGDNTLPDQVAGMKELASRYPWIDIDRAGIYGHSGGGFATAAAMFRYPDFFKVGVSQAGNHDNRVYEDDWAEKWQGLLEKNPDGTTNYDNQANQLVAHQLKGKLLLAHGSMDSNVPFYSTLLVVDALIKANKDFDLIIFPNRGHGFGNEPYMVRRRWDYFVRHLLGVEPPAYELKGPPANPPRDPVDLARLALTQYMQRAGRGPPVIFIWPAPLGAGSCVLPAPCGRGGLLREDLLEGLDELLHVLRRADRDAQVVEHRRERTADEDALLAELLDHALHRAVAEADHEEVGLRRNRRVAPRLEHLRGVVAHADGLGLDVGLRRRILERRHRAPLGQHVDAVRRVDAHVADHLRRRN